MSRFPSAAHLISWACICPRSDESAGKRCSTRIRKGSPWLKTTLVQAAWAAVNKKDSYLRAQFHRVKARRGAKKAIIAVAASILTAIYHMLKHGTTYRDLGAALRPSLQGPASRSPPQTLDRPRLHCRTSTANHLAGRQQEGSSSCRWTRLLCSHRAQSSLSSGFLPIPQLAIAAHALLHKQHRRLIGCVSL
jgi:transposase IS116/IS110/IS902 family protein